jgi:hypothetical protein
VLSIYAVDLDRVLADWRARPAAELGAALPGGRLARLLHAGGGGDDRRALLEALLEDRASAHLHDAPEPLLRGLAAAAGLPSLDEAAIRDGCRVWLTRPAGLAARVRDAAPEGADAELWRDVADALAEVLEAAAADEGVVVIA